MIVVTCAILFHQNSSLLSWLLILIINFVDNILICFTHAQSEISSESIHIQSTVVSLQQLLNVHSIDHQICIKIENKLQLLN